MFTYYKKCNNDIKVTASLKPCTSCWKYPWFLAASILNSCFQFSLETETDISFKLSQNEIVRMKCQSLFLTFHSNCLKMILCEWNVKPCLEKKKHMSCIGRNMSIDSVRTMQPLLIARGAILVGAICLA